MKMYLSLIAIILPLILSSCTSIVDATTKEPINPDPTRRSLGTYIDDKRLEVIVGVNIRKADENLKKSHVNVHSFNGVILLTGQVPQEDLRLLAAATAKDLPNVRQVHNELQVKGNTAFLARTNDSWLSTKVKTVLLANEDVKGLKVKTIVEDGVVYLMGLATRVEADTVSNVVSNIGGVKEVVRVFEYIETSD